MMEENRQKRSREAGDPLTEQEREPATEEERNPATEEERELSVGELFEELDGILKELDERDVSLEDSFALYEKGMKKVREVNEKLDRVEKKMLVVASDGSETPFEG